MAFLNPLRVIDFDLGLDTSLTLLPCMRSLIPVWLRLGFTIRSRGKLYLFDSTFKQTCPLDINKAEHPFVILDEADYVDA